MALNLVPLVLDLYDGGGNLITSGTASLTPTSSLVDATDNVYVTQSPLVVNFKVGASPLVEIVPTDNANIEPEGWAWQITFDNVPGDPPSYEFAIPGSGYVYSYTATFASPAVFTAAGSSLANGTPVVLAGSTTTLLGAFWPSTIYYVVDASGDTFSLAASVGGSAIASTSSGSGEVAVVQFLSSLTMIDDVQTVIPIPVSAGGTGSITQNWQGLLTPVSVTQSSGTYSASAGSLVKANIAGGSWTLSLPQTPPNNAVVGAKVMANATGNTNTLTIACLGSDMFEQSSGGTSSTLFLLSQAATWQYNSGYWTRLSDDLPLSQLDARYAKVFSPLAYGAAGNGTTDDTSAVQAAFAAAHAAGGGTIDVGKYVFLTSSPVTLQSNARVKGAVPQGAQGSAGAIVNNTGDLFSLASTVSNVQFDGIALTATAGHIWNAESSVCSFWEITNTYCSQASNSHSIWYQPNVSSSADSQAYSDMLIGDGCYFTCPTGAASVPPWYVITQDNLNSNTWRRLQAGTGNSSGVPFFYLENVGTSDFALASDNVFEDITGEQNAGGIIKALSVNNLTIRNVQGWDTEFLASVFTIGTSTTGLQSSGDIVILNSGRRGSYISGCYDVQASSDTTNLVLVNVDPRPLTGAGALTLSVPQSTTVIPAQPYTATTWLNSAAGGTNGTTVTTGNSGGTSGAVFDDVTGTVTFDSSLTLPAAPSGLSYKFAPSAATAYVYWVPNADAGAGVIPAPVQYMRCYVYVSSFPSSNMSILSLAGLNYYIGYSSGSSAWSAYAYPGTAVTSTAPASTATWYRLEAAFSQALGTTTLRVYSAGGVLLDEVTGTGGTSTTSNSAYYFGSQTAVTSTFHLAYVGWSNTGWIGA